MEWTKIKAKHFLFTDFSLLEQGALARLLSLTAYLERVPTSYEMARHVPQPTCKRLAAKLQTHCTTLAEVLEKVLEDVTGVQHKRAISRSTSKTYREKHDPEKNLGDASHDTTEKIREDKIREDKGKRKLFVSPTLERIKKEITQKGYKVKAEKFFYHYESNGWMVGRNKMKSWKMALANWNARNLPPEDKKPARTTGGMTTAGELVKKYQKESNGQN